jgi:hypothetical protein
MVSLFVVIDVMRPNQAPERTHVEASCSVPASVTAGRSQPDP